MTPVITVDRLHKRYGPVTAVEDVSFTVEPAEIFGVIGPNGAGKTTTVECLQGVRAPDGGEMSVLGLDPCRDVQRLRQRIGSQFQASALPDRMRVGEALDLFAAFATRAVPVSDLLEQWGLADRRDIAFGDLSGGQKQRLFIALAFVNDPEVVFLDELTQGLDPQARRATWDLIRAIRERGRTVVLVTHFMDEAQELCDRVAIIDRGRVVALDTPQGLIDRLQIPVTVRFSTDASALPDLEGLPQVEQVARQGPQVTVVGTGPVLARVAAALVADGILPGDLRGERPTLEDAFLALTGRSLRA